MLALEPYYGGSHRAFLDSWIRGSRHRWTLLDLPPYKWKWRMRHSAITFAEECERRLARGKAWDLLLSSDMLDLAQLEGLAPAAVQALPAVAYFHENQLTYPVRVEKERDLHFALANLSTAIAADRIWFNSAFHRESFLGALPAMLKRMPDHQPYAAVARLGGKSEVQHPGIDPPPGRGPRPPGPLRILWAARWEHDKDPETFFAALDRLGAGGTPFRVSVVGESFRRVPAVFAAARERLAERIDEWGYLESRSAYLAALGRADVLVSTAEHEFFGISVVEAMAAGAFPLLPDRLSYPELLAGLPAERRRDFLYEGGARALAGRLRELAGRLGQGRLWPGGTDLAAYARERFAWQARRPLLDTALESVWSSRAERPGETCPPPA